MELICRNCGPVDEYWTEKKANNLVAYCTKCGAYIKNLPQTDKPACLYFGKYKEKPIVDYKSNDEISYLKWVQSNFDKLKLSSRVIEAINLKLNSL